MSNPAPEPTIGTALAFPCPTPGCPGGEWRAFYYVPQSRRVDLFLDHGTPVEGNAHDDRITYDDDPGVTEFFECDRCGGSIALDGSIDEAGWADEDEDADEDDEDVVVLDDGTVERRA